MLLCSGRGAARLARLHGVQEVGGSNPLAPTFDPSPTPRLPGGGWVIAVSDPEFWGRITARVKSEARDHASRADGRERSVAVARVITRE